MAVRSRERSLPDPPGATWSGLVAHRGRGRFCPHPDVGGPPVSGRGESSGGRGRRFSKSAPEIPRRSVLSLPSFLHRLPPRHPLHRTGRRGGVLSLATACGWFSSRGNRWRRSSRHGGGWTGSTCSPRLRDFRGDLAVYFMFRSIFAEI